MAVLMSLHPLPSKVGDSGTLTIKLTNNVMWSIYNAIPKTVPGPRSSEDFIDVVFDSCVQMRLMAGVAS